jgi:hypothetical protein
MQILIFVVVAVGVYLLSDAIVRAIDSNRSEPVQNKQLVFFIVFFALILVAFELMKFLAPGAN